MAIVAFAFLRRLPIYHWPNFAAAYRCNLLTFHLDDALISSIFFFSLSLSPPLSLSLSCSPHTKQRRWQRDKIRSTHFWLSVNRRSLNRARVTRQHIKVNIRGSASACNASFASKPFYRKCRLQATETQTLLYWFVQNYRSSTGPEHAAPSNRKHFVLTCTCDAQIYCPFEIVEENEALVDTMLQIED